MSNRDRRKKKSNRELDCELTRRQCLDFWTDSDGFPVNRCIRQLVITKKEGGNTFRTDSTQVSLDGFVLCHFADCFCILGGLSISYGCFVKVSSGVGRWMGGG
jgi:hypothetical protein